MSYVLRGNTRHLQQKEKWHAILGARALSPLRTLPGVMRLELQVNLNRRPLIAAITKLCREDRHHSNVRDLSFVTDKVTLGC